jgi:hypothetical protein
MIIAGLSQRMDGLNSLIDISLPTLYSENKTGWVRSFQIIPIANDGQKHLKIEN